MKRMRLKVQCSMEMLTEKCLEFCLFWEIFYDFRREFTTTESLYVTSSHGHETLSILRSPKQEIPNLNHGYLDEKTYRGPLKLPSSIKKYLTRLRDRSSSYKTDRFSSPGQKSFRLQASTSAPRSPINESVLQVL